MIATRGHLTLQERQMILNCRRLPARLSTVETATVLGLCDHDIPVLVSGRLLTPLGRPAPNAPKYFAAVAVEANAGDPVWLNEATKTLAKHWATKNARKRGVSGAQSP